MKKIYYQLELSSCSPLRVGSGTHEKTDSDIMLDGRGRPFIPGSSLAGIIRHMAKSIGSESDWMERLFGNVDSVNETASSSRLIVGDAVLPENISDQDVVIGRRDGVGLNEWGMAKERAKFDFQMVEINENKKFLAILEWTGDDVEEKADIEQVLEPVLKQFVDGGLSAGAKTSRGYGKFKVDIRKKVFNFPEMLGMWLNFSPYDSQAFDDCVQNEGLAGDTFEIENEIKIRVKMTGTFAVRVNTARTELLEDGSLPDSVPLENIRGHAVIPGTAWAGVFRHHMHEMLRDCGIEEKDSKMKELDLLFGKDDHEKNRKSSFVFSETEIEGGQNVSIVRNAIDRFTASTVTGAFYTSQVHTGGEGVLLISYGKHVISSFFKSLMAACICDLHQGMVTVGGVASVGRGGMTITQIEVNGKSVLERMKASIKNGGALDWIEEEEEHE